MWNKIGVKSREREWVERGNKYLNPSSPLELVNAFIRTLKTLYERDIIVF